MSFISSQHSLPGKMWGGGGETNNKKKKKKKKKIRNFKQHSVMVVNFRTNYGKSVLVGSSA